MAETAGQTQTRRTTTYRDYGGRTRSYGAWGVLLLFAMIVAVALAYFQVQGPNLVVIEVAVWVLALFVFVMAVSLLYVLFTLRGALRQVREQATEVAVMRALAHRHEIIEPSTPAPSVEYNAPKERSAPLPGPTYVPPMVESRDVTVIEGIGPVFARRLQRAGIETVRDLRAATPDQLAEAANAPRMVVEKWRSMADLMAVRAIDAQAAEILVHCNIHSIEELGAQDVDTLHKRCVSANNSRENRIVPESISRDRVQEWVTAARNYGTDGSTDAVPRGGTESPIDAY